MRSVHTAVTYTVLSVLYNEVSSHSGHLHGPLRALQRSQFTRRSLTRSSPCSTTRSVHTAVTYTVLSVLYNEVSSHGGHLHGPLRALQRGQFTRRSLTRSSPCSTTRSVHTAVTYTVLSMLYNEISSHGGHLHGPLRALQRGQFTQRSLTRSSPCSTTVLSVLYNEVSSHSGHLHGPLSALQ